MANEHKGHRSRLRERVRREGLENFQDYQVLEYALTFVIPYKDTNLYAHQLINKFGSFYGVLQADEEDLREVDGIGEVTAHYLANLLKIFHYYEQDKAKKTVTIINPPQSYDFVKQFLQDKLVEELYMVCLTPKNKIMCVEKIAEGTASESSVSIRKISEKMNKVKCSNVIVAHNHPQGESTPSEDDHKFTKALIASLSISGCHLIDHIIIGDDVGDYYSYRKTHLIEEFKEEVAQMIGFNKHIAQPCARYEVDDD